MPRLDLDGKAYTCRQGETVLESLLRQGVNLPFSCRKGICQVCLHRAVNGTVPKDAQAGLRPALQALGYFLPCKCTPTTDLEIAPPRETDLYIRAVVHTKELRAPDVCRLLLEPASSLYYRAGQFINLRRADGLARSYSLASVPAQDYFLELHVKRQRDGRMSAWIFDELRAGDEIDIQGPQGQCYYVAGEQTQNLLLVGTGTGLAPLLGIARDALHCGHTGEIYLYHGSHAPAGLYLREQLCDLAARYPNLHFIGCVSGENVPAGFSAGRAHDVAFARHHDLAGWRVYLAGLAEMVYAAQVVATRAGAHPAHVHADPFELRDLRQVPRMVVAADEAATTGADAGAAPAGDRRRDPQPDPEMWAALREGALLNEILADFYARVYDDARLAPFFKNTTRQRSIEKQFLFLRQIFAGEKIYFGDRPRNAHHWMVISDELFDYREELMESCLRRYGLPEHLIRRWRAMEETYRADIVKSDPWNRVVDGVELPLEGFGEEVLGIGALCDGCGGEIAPGEKVRYHLRLGTTYCPVCAGRQTRPEASRAEHG
jgi:ferredoxin-NADP reductase/truncated hemoglobin YjbI